MARGSGNGPKAPPPPASRPTARLPGRAQALLPETARIRAHCLHHKVKSGSGAGGGGARRRRVGRGAPRFLAKCQPLEVAPSVFNPLGGREGRARGEGNTPGQTPTGATTCSYLPTHPSLRSPPPGNAGHSWEPGGTRGGRGATNPRGTLSTDLPSFLKVAHNFKFPPPGMLVSICCGWGRRAAPPPPDSRACPSPPLLPALSAHFWRCRAPRDLFGSHF